MPFTKNDPNINRNGRPGMSLAIAEMIRTGLEEIDQDTGKTKRETMIQNVIALAIKPNPDRWACEWLANRSEGRPAQTIHQVNTEINHNEWDEENETAEDFLNRELGV